MFKDLFGEFGRGINEMWDAIDNIWQTNKKSHQIFINNQQIMNIVV